MYSRSWDSSIYMVKRLYRQHTKCFTRRSVSVHTWTWEDDMLWQPTKCNQTNIGGRIARLKLQSQPINNSTRPFWYFACCIDSYFIRYWAKHPGNENKWGCQDSVRGGGERQGRGEEGCAVGGACGAASFPFIIVVVRGLGMGVSSVTFSIKHLMYSKNWF